LKSIFLVVLLCPNIGFEETILYGYKVTPKSRQAAVSLQLASSQVEVRGLQAAYDVVVDRNATTEHQLVLRGRFDPETMQKLRCLQNQQGSIVFLDKSNCCLPVEVAKIEQLVLTRVSRRCIVLVVDRTEFPSAASHWRGVFDCRAIDSTGAQAIMPPEQEP